VTNSRGNRASTGQGSATSGLARRAAVAVLLAGLTGGCDGGEGTPEDSGATAADSGGPVATGVCVDAPVVTYANFGRGFMTQHCQSCHASTTPDRHDAPEAVTFDDEEQVWAQVDRILARATGPEPTMPPQGGVSDDDRYLLEVWLSCGG
jgi:cytochrome c5